MILSDTDVLSPLVAQRDVYDGQLVVFEVVLAPRIDNDGAGTLAVFPGQAGSWPSRVVTSERQVQTLSGIGH